MATPVPGGVLDGSYTGPCGQIPWAPWISVEELRAQPGIDAAPSLPVGTDFADIVQAATDCLVEWCGRRYGQQTYTVYPRLGTPGWALWGWDAWLEGAWARWDGWGICDPTRIPLPRPVCSVVRVLIDGVELPSSSWQVYNRSELVRLDGDMWPAWQSIAEPGAAGFAVTLTQGAPPPSLGRMAAAELAAEIARALIPGSTCRLPSQTVQVVRQGVTKKVAPRDWLSGGATGLPLVDLFLATANPGRIRRRPSVAFPDQPTHMRRT